LNAEQTFARAQSLLKSGAGTQKDFDAAQSVLRDTQARLNSAQTRLVRRNVVRPGHGFSTASLLPAGRGRFRRPCHRFAAAASNLKGAFLRTRNNSPPLTYGDIVKVQCERLRRRFKARVSFISGSAEFTPPVIYSLDERSKLVFLIEALPDEPDKLRVGSRSM